MIDTPHIDHHIQKYILNVLMHAGLARFKEMRPPNVDSNLYNYHLKILIGKKLIQKIDGGYELAPLGIVHADRVSTATHDVRTQPKIVTMFVVQNDEGMVLLSRRRRHPFINRWTLPNGKVHLDDASLNAAAHREAGEKLGIDGRSAVKVGDCYIRTFNEGTVALCTLAHIYKLDTNDISTGPDLQWFKPHRLYELELAPAVEEIVARTFFKDPYFFEEYEHNW